MATIRLLKSRKFFSGAFSMTKEFEDFVNARLIAIEDSGVTTKVVETYYDMDTGFGSGAGITRITFDRSVDPVDRPYWCVERTENAQ